MGVRKVVIEQDSTQKVKSISYNVRKSTFKDNSVTAGMESGRC